MLALALGQRERAATAALGERGQRLLGAAGAMQTRAPPRELAGAAVHDQQVGRRLLRRARAPAQPRQRADVVGPLEVADAVAAVRGLSGSPWRKTTRETLPPRPVWLTS
jgi:hypothetical protein